MRKIRVAISLQGFAYGGAQRMVYELARSIDKDRFEVMVLCYEASPAPQLEEGLEAVGVAVRHVGPYGKIRLGALCAVARELDTFKPDLVHAHLGGAQAALPWCVLHRVPLVVTLHTTMPKALNPLVEKAARMDGSGKLIKLVAVSEATQRQAIQYLGCPEGRVYKVDNGIDLGEYRPANPCEEAVFVNVGTQDKNKNQAMLLEAFKEVADKRPGSRLILIGGGPEHEALVGAAAGDSRVELPGPVSNVPEWLPRANVYVQCSYREAMPMAIIEAIASGLPVVTTNVGGVGDVVRDGREGFLVEPGSKDSLAEAMLRLCDPGLRGDLSAGALARAQAFGSAAMARSYEGIYLEAVGGR